MPRRAPTAINSRWPIFRRSCSQDSRADSGNLTRPPSQEIGSKNRSAGSWRFVARVAGQSSLAFVLVHRVPWGHLHLNHLPQRHRGTEKTKSERIHRCTQMNTDKSRGGKARTIRVVALCRSNSSFLLSSVFICVHLWFQSLFSSLCLCG